MLTLHSLLVFLPGLKWSVLRAQVIKQNSPKADPVPFLFLITPSLLDIIALGSPSCLTVPRVTLWEGQRRREEFTFSDNTILHVGVQKSASVFRNKDARLCCVSSGKFCFSKEKICTSIYSFNQIIVYINIYTYAYIFF